MLRFSDFDGDAMANWVTELLDNDVDGHELDNSRDEEVSAL